MNVNTKVVTTMAVAFVVLLFYSVSITERFFEQKEVKDKLEETVSDTNQKIQEYKVRLNDSTEVYAARVNDLEYTQKNIKAQYDSLLKASGIKAKDVQRITEVRTEVRETVREIPVYYDSFGGLKTGYSDKFTDIHVEIDSTRKASIDYSVRDSLVIINTQKKHSILFGLIKWKEHLQTTVMSTNPKMKITGVTAIDKIE